MSRKHRTSTPIPGAPATNGATVERRIELSPIEVELVQTAAAENNTAKQTADAALAKRLSVIRNAHSLDEGMRADFRPTKDGKSLVMVVFEPKA